MKDFLACVKKTKKVWRKIMTKRRILSMALVGCMLSAMMTACGGNSSSTNSSTSGGDTTSTTKRDDGIFELNSDVFSKPNSDPGSDPGSDPDSDPNSNTASNSSNSSGSSSEAPKPTFQQAENLDDLKPYEREVYKKLPELKIDAEKKLTILFGNRGRAQRGDTQPVYRHGERRYAAGYLHRQL